MTPSLATFSRAARRALHRLSIIQMQFLWLRLFKYNICAWVFMLAVDWLSTLTGG